MINLQADLLQHWKIKVNFKDELRKKINHDFFSTYARERLKTDKYVTEHAQQNHLILEATPDLGQVYELWL